METRSYAYIRVSTQEQNETRQLEKMKALGIIKRDTFIDKASGKDFDRENYQALKRVMRKGDLLYVDALDRLGRNYDAIISEWKDITRNIGADIIVLENESLFNSRKFRNMGDVGKVMEDQFLSLFSYIAEQERNKIRTRQAEGIKVAKTQGKHLGRPKAEFTEGFKSAYAEWKAGNITAVEAMKKADMKKTTFYKLVNQLESEQSAG
ncbi:recombinase family protein [Metabacillus bambusae]|uniref:Recombinase family protein n=1 Tax=Metabacillus bambusae TaxID=2795218 RepID=A0ABS3N620_9BACI|nr:recombinase family protein [Metabacillus bambusae]MBO1513702.1 recombinase family protein [Metabacillus bambusae]